MRIGSICLSLVLVGAGSCAPIDSEEAKDGDHLSNAAEPSADLSVDTSTDSWATPTSRQHPSLRQRPRRPAHLPGGHHAPPTFAEDCGVDGEDDAAGEEPDQCGWEPFNTGLSGASVLDTLIDARADGVIYAAAGANLYRSADGGRSFVVQGSLPGGRLLHLDAPGSDPNLLLAATSIGLARSIDAGRTWTIISLNGLNLTTIAASSSQPLSVYASSNGAGVFGSSDGGFTWSTPGSGIPFSNVMALTVNPLDHNDVVAALSVQDALGGPKGGAIVTSLDGGITWQTAYASRDWIGDVARCAADPSVLIAPRDGTVARSEDGGRTWESLPPARSGFVASVAISASDCDDFYTLYYVDGLYRSRDGGASYRRMQTNGVEARPLGTISGALAVDSSDADHVVMATHGGVYSTFDGGDDWTTAGGFNQLNLSLIADADGPGLFAAGWGSGLWRRESGREPWTRIASSVIASDYVYFAANMPGTPRRSIAGIFGLGLTIFSDSVESQGLLSAYNPWVAAFDPRDALTVYVGTQVGGVFKSIDGGATFVESNSGLSAFPTPNGQFIDIRGLVVDPADPDTLFIGTFGRGIWKSADGGGSWRHVFGDNERTTCLTIVAGSPSKVYACSTGIHLSEDGGETFADISAGLPSLEITGLAVDRSTGTAYASTPAGVHARAPGGQWHNLDDACGISARTPVIVEGRLVVASQGTVMAHALE